MNTQGNEISNNFATTVENLAQGQAKAGATAKALGMDFDQLNAVVGTLNARTKQSGNEIGNFIKSTFSNVLSNKGRDVLAGLGVELENADGTMRDIMQVYKEVAVEYQKLNQTEKNAVVLGLGGKYHVSRLQTLLDDLGSVDSMYDKMYDTSQNSANSAMEENQTYMQSLEARINLARVEVEKLALAIGEAFMTEGMVQALQAFRVLAEAITSVVKQVGFLPIAFLGIVTILGTLSNRFGDVIEGIGRWIGSIGRAKQALNEQTTALSNNNKETDNNNRGTTELIAVNSDSTKETDRNTESTDKNTEAKKRASKASKLLSVGFGALGLASIGVGFAIEGLLSWIGKARQEEEEFNNTVTEQIATFEANQDQITTLSKRYSELSNADKSIEAGTEEYAELTEIQNELARLLPTVKKGEDGLGNSILQSAGYVEQKVAMMEKQLEIQQKLNEEEALAKREEEEEKARDTVKDSQDDVDSILGGTGNNIYKFKNAKNYTDDSGKAFNLKKELGLDSWDEDLKNAEQMSKAITKIREALLKKDEYGFSDGYTKQMEIALESLVEKYQKVEKANLKVLSSTDLLRDGYISDIDDIVKNTKDFEDEALETFQTVASGALAVSETEEEFEAFNEALEAVFSNKDSEKEFSESFNSLQTTINNMKNSSITDLDEFKKKYDSTIDDIIAKILKLSGFKVDSPEYKNLEESLKTYTKGIYDYEVSLREASKTEGKTVAEMREHFALYGEGADAIEGLSSGMQEYVDSVMSFSSVGERLLGVTEKQITETDDLMGVYSHLANMTDRTTEEQEIYTDALNKLNALYPHLVQNGQIRIDNLEVEQKMNKVLAESNENMADEKYKAENSMTYYSAIGTKARIANLQTEIKAMQELAGATYSKYEEIMKKYKENGAYHEVDNPNGITESEQRFLMSASQSRGEYAGYAEYSEKVKKLEGYFSELNTSVNTLSSSNVKYAQSESKSSETKEKATKETSELEKATDKYALALDKLDTQLAKIQAKQEEYSTHSKQYRDSILEENKLIEQQIALNKQKANDLSKAPKTTTTTTSSSNSKSIDYNTFTNVKPKGWNNTITSQFGMRNGSMHNGIDVDGAIGDRLDSNVNGKVLKAGNASDIGEHWSYGNLVIIQDKDNKKHYYAHLDNVSVVAGQELTAGTKIGTIGNTGNVIKGKGGDGSHLHYGVKNGNSWENPYNYVKQAQSGVQAYGTNSTSSSSSSSSSTKDDYNDRMSEIEAIEQENTALYQQLQENKYRIVESRLEEYARSVSLEDSAIAKQEALQNNMLEHSQAYEKSVKKQMESEDAKLKLYQSEYDYLQKMIESGELTNAQEENLLNRRYELQQLMLDSQAQAKQYYNEVISGYLAKLDNRMNDYADTLAWEEVKIQSLSRESERYNKTLEIMKKARQGQVNTMKEELSYVNRMLSKGNLSIEMYENLAQRANELKRELVETTLAIQELNYEMIQTQLIVADEKIDDIDFKIGRSQSIRSRYDEDSGDYYKELGYELDQLENKLVELGGKENHLRDALSNPTDLGHDELQDLEEQLEDTSQAYQDVQTSIHQTKKAMDDFNSSIDEEVNELKESLADDIIDMLKEAIEDLRDIQIEAIEDLIEAEEERHEKAMKQLDDELERYNDIIDAKRREIDDEDRDRTHNNNLDELTQRKQELESQITLLSSSNVYADIKEREGLQKELADVEKEIEEENYQYSKELREQQLDDLLKAKEDNIEEQKELEEKNSANTLKELDRQKEYWDKYYDEILSDEANFQRIRREVIAGNYDILETEFNGHIAVLKDSLNKMGISFDSMTSVTGKKIKDNILSSLTLIREEITKVSSEIDKILAKKNTVTNGFGSSYDFDDSILDNSNRPDADTLPNSSQNLTEANLKVILAKFMKEQIAGSLNPNTDSVRIANIKSKADKLAEEGRSQGATIMSTESLSGLFDRFTEDEMKQVGSYFQSNASSSGFQTQDYLNYIQQFGSSVSQGSAMTTGDKQVLFAKYLKEFLMPQISDASYRSAVGSTADKIAENGRSKTSLIQSNVGYSQSIGRLSNTQLGELGDFFLSNAGVIGNATYRKLVEQYANGTLIPKRNTPASLDSGGYTGNFGSTGGVDGKGGKYAVLHQKEIVLNPLDTERMFQISAIMENVMKNIGKAISLPTLPKIHKENAPTSSDNSTHIHINIDKMNGTQSDIDKLSKQISNKLLREKGKR